MRVTRKISVVKKAVRGCKLVIAPVIKWVLNDNLCLLYAIWEMCRSKDHTFCEYDCFTVIDNSAEVFLTVQIVTVVDGW